MASASFSWARSMNALGSASVPSVAGYCSTTANTGVLKSNSAASPVTISIPIASVRVRSTEIVCGWQLSETNTALALLRDWMLRHIVSASAAAVASSSSEALAISMPERSQTIVWKLSSASRRPCEISA